MEIDLQIAASYLKDLLEHPSCPADVRGGEPCYYKWSPDLPYSSDVYAAEVKKDPARDFVILNFSDIQCHDGEAFCQVGEMAEETIDKLIKTVHPDLITMTGDNAFDQLAYMRLIQFIDSYGIPWAPVMGNADLRDVAMDEFWAGYRLAHAKNCLFRFGPEGMGYGNYVVNITENGKIIHTLFFTDTHVEDDDEQGRSHYKHLSPDQMAWYEWCARGIAAEAGHPVPSTVFMHVPVREYEDAWLSILDKDGKPTGPAAAKRYCQVRENYGYADDNNGFFALCQKLGTRAMLAGHDHRNCFAIPYGGITLAYACKTGYGCYWDPDTNGGTVITIGADGEPNVDFRFIDPRQSRVKKFVLDYFGINLFAPKDCN